MNSNSNGGSGGATNGYATSGSVSGSVHYHSSNINNGKPMFMNGNRYSQDDVDSGQGSSLDRDYGLYNNYPKQTGNGNGVPPGTGNNKQDAQYYYNLPQHQQNGTSPPRRSEGLDLTNNREYRGSAFELYKKPLSEARQSSNGQQPQNQYYSNQSVAR